VLVYPKVTAMISADCSLLGAVYQAMDSFGAGTYTRPLFGST